MTAVCTVSVRCPFFSSATSSNQAGQRWPINGESELQAGTGYAALTPGGGQHETQPRTPPDAVRHRSCNVPELACRGRCEEDVRAVVALVDRNIKLSPQTARILEAGRKTRSSTATFNLVTGAIFVAWGLSDTERFRFIVILGVCFLAFGIFGLFQARRLAKDRQET